VRSMSKTPQYKKWITGFAVMAIVATLVWLVLRIMPSTESLSIADAKSQIQDLYSGEIIEISEQPTTYMITMELDKGTYEIEMNRETGDISRMIRKTVTASKDVETDSPEKSNQPSTNPEEPNKDENTEQKPDVIVPPPPTIITEDEAISIALQNVNGEFDDIKLKQSGDLTYYLVEIETDDRKEATVQIHAISGELLSISWDD
jgi:uncharacterized membrane protein YkoI